MKLTIGNPELKPTTSYNFDLSADYYFRSIGLVSAGIFYKKIDDFHRRPSQHQLRISG